MSLFGTDATSYSHLDLGIQPFLSSSVRLDGKHWWTAIFRSLQRCSIWVYVRAGPFKNSHGVVVKPLLCYFSGVLRVIALLEGEPSAQSEVQSTLEKVFAQDIPVLGHIHLSLDCNQSSCPCSRKTPPQHDAATTMLHCWGCIGQVMSSAWFSPHIPLWIRGKQFYLGLIRPEDLITILESFRCFFFCKRHVGFRGHSAIKPRLVDCCSDGSLGYSLPLSPRLFYPNSSVWPGGQL